MAISEVFIATISETVPDMAQSLTGFRLVPVSTTSNAQLTQFDCAFSGPSCVKIHGGIHRMA